MKKRIGRLFCFTLTFFISTTYALEEKYPLINTHCTFGEHMFLEFSCATPYSQIGPYVMKRMNTIGDKIFSQDFSGPIDTFPTKKEYIELRGRISNAINYLDTLKAERKDNEKILLAIEIIELHIEHWFLQLYKRTGSLQNEDIVFDSCKTLEYYLNQNNTIRGSGLKQHILKQETGAGGTYGELSTDSYSLNDFEACYSQKESQIIFFLGGRRTCRSIYRYNFETDILIKAKLHDGACPSSFGERNKILNYIEVYGEIDEGVPYSGKYFYNEDWVTQ